MLAQTALQTIKINDISTELYKQITAGSNALFSDQLPSALITYFNHFGDAEIYKISDTVYAFMGYEYDQPYKKFITLSGMRNSRFSTTQLQKIKLFAEKHSLSTLQYIPENWAHDIAESLRLLPPTLMDDSTQEYIYSTEEQSRMVGGKFADRRWRKNKFDKLYGEHITLKVVDGQIGLHLKEVVGLFQDWKNYHTQGSYDYHTEIPAFEIFANNELIRRGSEIATILLYYKDKLIAFSTIEIINDTSATCYFQKSNLNITAINDYFFYAVNHYLFSRGIHTYNYQEDAEINGLAQFKKRLLPNQLTPKYQLHLN